MKILKKLIQICIVLFLLYSHKKFFGKKRFNFLFSIFSIKLYFYSKKLQKHIFYTNKKHTPLLLLLVLVLENVLWWSGICCTPTIVVFFIVTVHHTDVLVVVVISPNKFVSCLLLKLSLLLLQRQQNTIVCFCRDHWIRCWKNIWCWRRYMRRRRYVAEQLLLLLLMLPCNCQLELLLLMRASYWWRWQQTTAASACLAHFHHCRLVHWQMCWCECKFWCLSWSCVHLQKQRWNEWLIYECWCILCKNMIGSLNGIEKKKELSEFISNPEDSSTKFKFLINKIQTSEKIFC